ncbi:MAG: helix-turn-helix domain-containing protein [Planctomycetaceae bacterium]|nr:helix-turn-helix domain-containing protein [Planctomycetaceae bacterium]
MDVLADFLRTVGVAAQVDPSPYRNQDWGHATEGRLESTGTARLKMLCVAAGEYSLVEKETRRPLTQGDVVFLAAGSGYRVTSLKSDATLITGSIIFRTGVMALTALNLPSATIVRGIDQPECQELVVRIAKEVLKAEGGWEQVAECLAISLFISSLRASGSCQANEGNGQGWLRALVDPEIGNALKLMHRAPEYRWTIAELAEELAISRSAFAERFKKITGRPPLEYLTWWRLQRAAARLRSGEIATLYEAAKTSGYQSEAAFSKAFRREFGMPPGEVRRQAQARKGTPSQLQLDIKKRNPFEFAEQEVGLNFVKSYEAIRRPFEELLENHGLSGAEYNILRILRGRNSPMTFDEVVSHLLIPHANVPEHFARLVSRQYIIQEKDSFQYVITDLGQSVLKKLDEPIMSLHRQQFAHFSTGEIAEMNRLLVKLRTPSS